MIGIVLVTHGNLADEFLSAMQHVVGHQSQIKTACIGPNDDMNQRRDDILAKVQEVDTGDGVAVLTDMFGGTPSNLAISIMDMANIEVIAGTGVGDGGEDDVAQQTVGGDLGNHTAVYGVYVDLREYLVCEHFASVAGNGNGSFVAGGFHGHNNHLQIIPF